MDYYNRFKKQELIDRLKKAEQATADAVQRAQQAEQALETERADPQGEARGYALAILADAFESVVPVPNMTGEQFDIVLEARRLC